MMYVKLFFLYCCIESLEVIVTGVTMGINVTYNNISIKNKFWDYFYQTH